VRVKTYVTEKPVQEQVTLREERVNVERRPVDRPAGEADFQNFREGTIEVTETAEKPVVAKEARVVEEVLLNKDVQQRTETVQDTVRRKDVEVHDLGTTGRRTFTDW
jgi:stress response protein YsnF